MVACLRRLPRATRRRFQLSILVPLLPLYASGASAGVSGLDYPGTSDFLPQTPGVTAGAPGGLYNPAAWSLAPGELAAWLTPRGEDEGGRDDWGFALAGPLGFAMDTRHVSVAPDRWARLRSYQFGLAGGDRRTQLGAAWRWHGGDADRLGVENGLVLGALLRPNPWAGVGLSGFFAGGDDFTEGTLDLGLRPLGTPLLTLFADYTLRRPETDAGVWGGGVGLRPTQGLELIFKARDGGDEDARFHVGLGVTFDGAGVHAMARRTEDLDHESMSYLARLRPPYRGIPLRRELDRRFGTPVIVPVSLENRVLTYQKDRWFDGSRIAWLDLLQHLDAIRDEPGAAGIALDLSDFRGRPSLVWELRGKLEELRAAGKQIHVHANRLDMSGLYLASAADEITLDPQGGLMVPGLALHRTYLRGALEKLGLGAEEWRYFSHKTAFQSYSRADMSDADREQLGRLVDVIYETWRAGICEGRRLTPQAFDAVVDGEVLLLPARAQELGLVDRLGRWPDLVERLDEQDALRIGPLPGGSERRVFPDERWGRPPEIAIVYAVGECAMDAGIRGRATGKHLRGLAKRGDVAAVVLRADSPGGDPLPSDLVADGTRELKEKGKPVVVSQGDVAASGGYWISMDGSRVLTTPFTITGSIGVIAGWIWDDGFSKKFGLTADGVQRGAHADLFTGVRIPLLDGVVPERAVTDEERGMMKRHLLAMYDDFVKGVAGGRGLPEERVRAIGEGRVWMGGDAMERGLTDAWGGLGAAIMEAKKLAGLEAQAEVILKEYPPRKLFTLPSLLPGIPGIRGLAARLAPRSGALPEMPDPAVVDPGLPYELLYIRGLAQAPGRPLMLVPPEDLPRGWGEEPRVP